MINFNDKWFTKKYVFNYLNILFKYEFVFNYLFNRIFEKLYEFDFFFYVIVLKYNRRYLFTKMVSCFVRTYFFFWLFGRLLRLRISIRPVGEINTTQNCGSDLPVVLVESVFCHGDFYHFIFFFALHDACVLFWQVAGARRILTLHAFGHVKYIRPSVIRTRIYYYNTSTNGFFFFLKQVQQTRRKTYLLFIIRSYGNNNNNNSGARSRVSTSVKGQ